MHLPPPNRSRAIVLVHGAWVGEWSWLPVLGPLTASGRAVHPVSLTGHGCRSHESGPAVDLSAHVADVVEVIRTFDLSEVTLVGHSYGGRVITRVHDEVADRIGSLVYVDAHAPVAPEPPAPAGRAELAAEHGGMLPFFEIYTPTDELVGDAAWFMDRVMPQSYACFTEDWQRDLPVDLPKVFVHATGSGDDRFAHYAAAAEADPGWVRRELPGPHFLMMSHPAELAAIILAA